MKKIKDFYDLDVWKMGKELTLRIYRITNSFPHEERYGITSQLRRAGLSIAGNIAEGFGRFHYLDRVRFYLNARGSLYELKSHLLIACELNFINNDIASKLYE